MYDRDADKHDNISRISFGKRRVCVCVRERVPPSCLEQLSLHTNQR